MRRRFGDLPEDLRKQDDSLSPPPAWFPIQNLSSSSYEYCRPFNKIQQIKLNQQFSPNIPRVARRYTDIKPLSPFFRRDIKKFGFGEVDLANLGVLALITVASAVVVKKYLL